MTIYIIFLVVQTYSYYKAITWASFSMSVPYSSAALRLPQPTMVHICLNGRWSLGFGRHATPCCCTVVGGRYNRAKSLSTVSTLYLGWITALRTYSIKKKRKIQALNFWFSNNYPGFLELFNLVVRSPLSNIY